MGASNNSIYIEFDLFYDTQMMMYRVSDFSPVEPFFQDSYSSSAFEEPEIFDSLSTLLKYNTKPVSQPLSSKIDLPIFSLLEHYESVSFASLLRNSSPEKEKDLYPVV